MGIWRRKNALTLDQAYPGINWLFKVDNLNENVASEIYFGQIYMTTLIEKNLKNFALT